MRAIRAAWIRGGTSKGLFFRACDLPPHGPERDALILAALGSPDPSGLQLNGVGGGISSTSKVAILSQSHKKNYDIDYLFGQVEIKDRRISWEGSCGNLAAGVGLFALAEGLRQPSQQCNEAVQQMRVWQMNQGYGMRIHMSTGVNISTLDNDTATAPNSAQTPDLLQLACVPGREPRIYVELLEPHGTKPLLPTGNVVDKLHLPDGSLVEATLVTPGNPTVLVSAKSCGLSGSELPADMDYARILPLVEHLRRQAAPLLGVELSDQPRVAFLAPPQTYTASNGETICESSVQILSRISTPGRIHHAHTGTGSIALACASHVKGSVAWKCISEWSRPGCGEELCIGHPGGAMTVKADVQWSKDRGWFAVGAGFDRTARYLMRGEVFVPPSDRAP